MTKEVMILLVDDWHGIFAGQMFAEVVDREKFPSMDSEGWEILDSGPDHEHYSDVCDDLEGLESSDGYTVTWQDGALWAIDYSQVGHTEGIVEAVESTIESIKEDSELWSVVLSIWNDLMYGPLSEEDGTPVFRRENLDKIKQGVSAHCQTRELPRYWFTDYGIGEESVDLESLVWERCATLKTIKPYI